MKLTDVKLVIPIIVALLLRVPLLNAKNFSVDEAALWITSGQPLSQIVHFMSDCNEVHPPLYQYLMHLPISICPKEWFLRTPSLLFSIIAIPLLYRYAIKMFRRGTAILASILLATSSFDIGISSEFRMYSFLTLLFLLSANFTQRILKNNSSKALLLLTPLNVCGLYTHYLYLFSTIAQTILFATKCRRFFKKWLMHLGLIILLYLPWLYHFTKLKGQEHSLRTIPHLQEIMTAGSRLIFGNEFSGRGMLLLAGVALLLLIAIIAICRIEIKTFILTFFVGILAVTYIFKINIFETKYFICILPFVVLGVAELISKIKRLRFQIIVIAIIIILNLFTLYQNNFSTAAKSSGDWKEISNFLEHNSTSKDLILVNPAMYSTILYYYYHGEAKIRPVTSGCKELISELGGYSKLWLISLPEHPHAKKYQFQKWMDQFYIKKAESEFGKNSRFAGNYIKLTLYGNY